jgi:hypothetical protein
MSRSRKLWWLNALARSLFPTGPARQRRRSVRLRLEPLEDRVTPTAYTVNIAGDTSGLAGGSGSGTSGDLRYCISQAIADGQTDTISFASSLAGGTIALDSSLVTEPAGFANPYGQTAFIVGASDNITIDGSNAPGLDIGGGNATRLFVVEGGGTLELENLTLSGGSAQGGDGGDGHAAGGGGAGLGGAVLVDGSTFTAQGCTFVNNQAAGGAGDSGGSGGYGGGNGGGGGLGGGGAGGARFFGGNGGGPNGGRGTSSVSGFGGGFGGGGGGGGWPAEGGNGGFPGPGGAGGFGGGGGGGGADWGGAGGFGGGGGAGAVYIGGAGGFGGGSGAKVSGSAEASGGGGAGLGGSIFSNGGSLTLTNDTFTANTATGGPGGSGVNNGGAGQGDGGAVFARNGMLTATLDTFSGNTGTNGDGTAGQGRDVYVLSDASDGGNGTSPGSGIATATLVGDVLSQSSFVARTNAGGTVAPPTSVQIVNPVISSSGQVSFSAAVSGPTAADQQAGYGYIINWGDGTTTLLAASPNNGSGSLVLPSHTYAPGIYTIGLTATDDGGLSKSTTALVVVSATAQDSITLSGAGSPGQVAVATTDEGSFTTAGTPDQVLVAGSGGSDSFAVNLGTTLTVPVALVGSGATGGDTFTANGAAGDNYFDKTAGQLTWAPQASPAPPVETIQYAGIQNQVIIGGSGNNYFNDPGSQNTTLIGGAGNNTFLLANTVGNGVVVQGGPVSNTYLVNLGNLAGPVTITNSNTSASNSLTVNGAPGDNAITAAGNQVTAGTQTITDTASLANLTVTGGSGNNQITVGNLTVPVQNLAVNGGGGTNTVTLVNLGTSVASLSVSGGSGTTQVQVQGSLPPNLQAQNLPPLVGAGSGVQAREGISWNTAGSFTDAAAGLTFTATVDYGDGTGVHPLALNADHSFLLQHAYAAKGTYTVSVQVSDNQGHTGTGSFVATVADTIGLVLLDLSGKGALTLSGAATLALQGEEFAFLDSASAQAAVLSGSATATGEEFDIGGKPGVQTSGTAKLQGGLHTGVAALADPLAALRAPTAPTPTFAAVKATGTTVLTLQPGTYVGGISVSGSAVVTLLPGLYYLQGGGLSVSGSGKLTGSGVVIYNAPQKNSDGISVSGSGSVSLSPPTTGTYAGIALFQARASAAALSVTGSGVLSLGGTLYAPAAVVSVSGGASLTVQGNGTTAFPAQVIAYDLTDSGSSVVIGTPLPIQQGETATAGFWNGASGQQLLTSFNGGSNATALGNWLASSFANLYGSGAGANNLAGLTNAQVAAYFQALYAGGGLAVQVLTTALNVYATTLSLGGTAAVAYGFLVTNSGVGAATISVGSSGAAFGVANNSTLSILQLLQAANAEAKNGLLYNGNVNLDAEALTVFSAVNQAGGIGS